MSLTEITETGLIEDEEKQKALIRRLKPTLEPNYDLFVYVSEKHGSGAGSFSIIESSVSVKNIEIDATRVRHRREDTGKVLFRK